MSTERDLQDELARLDASITVLERVPSPSERARRDLDAQHARRAQVAEALAALRGSSQP